jgi:peptidoglycan/LPS O-acetylase OafA/YrhL
MKVREYRLGYRGDIEGLRAVAILLVIAAHAGIPWLRGGFVGVDVFFVLSGYLITALLVQEVERDGRIRFAAFYARRLSRLLPALLFMVCVVGLLAAVLLPPGAQTPDTLGAASASFWASNLFFAYSHVDYFGRDAGTNLFLHTWSLGVEEQFYLVWPALIALLLLVPGRKLRMNVQRLKIAMSLIAVLSFAACAAWTYSSQRLAFYLMPSRAWEFALGALTLLHFGTPDPDRMLSVRRQSNGRTLRLAGILGACCIFAAAVAFNSRQPYPGLRALLPAIGTALVLAAGAVGASGISRLLAGPPMQAIGRVSYSWYLWHWPVLLLGSALVIQPVGPIYRLGFVAVSLALATFSYFVVEAPIRRSETWMTRPGRAILAALVLMVLVNALCLRWWHATEVWANAPEQRRYADAHADAPIIYLVSMDCGDWVLNAKVHVCAFGPRNAPHTAVLMGDSLAGQWFPAVAAAFNKPGWRLFVLTKSACPMVDFPVFYERIGREYTECAIWRARALKYLSGVKPDIVILSSFPSSGFDERQWVDGTVDVLGKISADVKHVFLLRATPRLPFDGPDCLAARHWRPSLLDLAKGCRAPADSRQNDKVYAWLTQAAGRFGNVTTMDLNDLVCPEGTCVAERQGRIVFRDNQHMTASFARSLGPDFARKIDVPKWTTAEQARP